MNDVRLIKYVVVLGALLGLSACVDTASMGSEAFVEGWRMGCYSGYTDAGIDRYWGLANNTPINGDSPDYQPAWDEGYMTCFDSGLSGDPTFRTLPAS